MRGTSSSQTAMSTSSCGRVMVPAWKSTAHPPKSQYAIPASPRSASTAPNAASWPTAVRRRSPCFGNGRRRSACRLPQLLLAGDLHERIAIPLREERVAVDVEVDLGEHELVGERQRRGVDLGAADDEDTLDISRSASASSTDPARSAPDALQARLRVTTTLRRSGSGRKRSGSDSQVFRPITTA